MSKAIKIQIIKGPSGEKGHRYFGDRKRLHQLHAQQGKNRTHPTRKNSVGWSSNWRRDQAQDATV